MSGRHFGIPARNYPLTDGGTMYHDQGRAGTTAHHLTPGQVRSGARHHAPPVEARCNLSSFAADPSFPRSPFAQAVLDVTAVIFAFLFVSVTALAIVGAVFILLFVRL